MDGIEPEALLAVLTNPAYHFKRIGLEAGPLSQWLFNALAEAGLPGPLAGICGEYTAIASTIHDFIPARYRGWADLAGSRLCGSRSRGVPYEDYLRGRSGCRLGKLAAI